jgi:hypothetical protein
LKFKYIKPAKLSAHQNLISRILLSSVLIFSSYAQAITREHPITIDDFFDIASMTDAVISPDGKQAVWVESRWDKALDRSQTDLWQINTNSRKTIKA